MYLIPFPIGKRIYVIPGKNYSTPMQAIDRLIVTISPSPTHVRAHSERTKPDHSTLTPDKWGKYLADRAAAQDWAAFYNENLMVQHITISAHDLIRNLLGPDRWYLCNTSGAHVPTMGLQQAIQAYRHRIPRRSSSQTTSPSQVVQSHYRICSTHS